MASWEPVGSIRQLSNSGKGDEDRPEFIRCVDGQDPQIHEVWTLCEDGITREVNLTLQVDVSAGFVCEFLTK